MNDFLGKIEKRFSKYAIHNLSLYIIIAYVIGYILQLTGTMEFLRLNPYAILHGQVWRVVTWLIVPSYQLNLFTIFFLFLCYSLGTSLERTWGTFRYNVYFFSGVIFTILGAFILYAIYAVGVGLPGAIVGNNISASFSTYYIYLSFFLAVAVLYPDIRLYLYFFIPIKMKWLAILDIVLVLLDFFRGNIAVKIAIIMSLLNFFIFFIGTMKGSIRRVKRKAEFKAKMQGARTSYESSDRAQGERHTQSAGGVISKHKCAICGRTELDNPDLEFRFCSKCNGNYEYCNDHLFTHIHKQ